MATTTQLQFYPVRLGPLRFTCLVGDIPEPLGDRLEAVGAALTPGERQPRAAQIVLPVAGSHADVDPRESGLALRRQVRALMENTAWKQQGLYFEAGWDPETAAWLMVGGGSLTDEQRGFAFGDWRLTMEDAYLVGRPSTHRRGRRVVKTDRASGLVATDTRGQLYTTDLAGVAATAPKPTLPGDIDLARGLGNVTRPIAAGPAVDGRTLFSSAYAFTAPQDGEVVSWRPNAEVLTEAREREASVEDVGGMRVWALPGSPGPNTPTGDRQPDLAYGWEQVMGPLSDSTQLLAMENGWVRCTWLGAQLGGGLRVERWSTAEDRYVQAVRFAVPASTAADARAIEVTGERVVIEVATYFGDYVVTLQRGWPGPRIEAYNISGGGVLYLGVAGPGSRSTLTSLVDKLSGPGGLDAIVARCTSTSTWSAADSSGDSFGSWAETSGASGKPLVLQVDVQTDLADTGRRDRALALARWDVRSIPVLVGR